MKPHYLAIPAAVELYLLIRRGWRTAFVDPIPWSIGLVAVAHVVSMYTIFSDYGPSCCRSPSRPMRRSATRAGAAC